jgi:hypothetical protein
MARQWQLRPDRGLGAVQKFVPDLAVVDLCCRRLQAVHDTALRIHADMGLHPKYQSLPFLVDDISGSRAASMKVPSFSTFSRSAAGSRPTSCRT